MQRVLAALAFLAIIAVGSQARAACTVTPGFENGDVADATVLINDLNDLAACAAPLASPNFTGAVGIGTTTPGATLDVYASTGTGLNVEGGAGGVDIATFRRLVGAPVAIGLSGGAADAYMYLQDAAGVTWSTGVDDAASSSFKISNGDAPGTNDYLTITTAGNVGIGTTSPATALDVVGTIRQTNCTTAGTLSANTAGDIICTSDGRLKTVLGDYTVGLEALAHISPKLFTYKPTKSDPVETFVHAGFVAQNVMTVIPQASALQRDGYYSLDTTAVLAATVNSVKQLKALADKQAAEIGQLRTRLEATGGQLAAANRAQAAAIRLLQAQMAALQHKGRVRTASN